MKLWFFVFGAALMLQVLAFSPNGHLPFEVMLQWLHLDDFLRGYASQNLRPIWSARLQLMSWHKGVWVKMFLHKPLDGSQCVFSLVTSISLYSKTSPHVTLTPSVLMQRKLHVLIEPDRKSLSVSIGSAQPCPLFRSQVCTILQRFRSLCLSL